ncbi:MAG: hypothetical protein JWO57_4408, partial [Pseudonocardiales bacterium]|nr:hypothetical protein [Pseudonocardiales bacterium]
MAPEALVDELADLIATRPIAGRALRVALDGPSCTDPSTLAGAVGVALQARGRPVAAIRGETFWRDASLR